ncbi:MAG: histidine kinase [Salibacteraceae bacterium]
MRILKYSNKLVIVFLLFLSFFSHSVFSQTKNGYTFQNINKGFPSNEVYSIAQDDYGFLWFGTERGIARYDGHEFVNYGIDEGLNDATVFKLIKIGKLIWFKCYNGDVGVIEDFKIRIIRSYPSSDFKLHELLSNGKNIVVTWSGKDRIVNYDVLSKTGEILIRELGKSDSLSLNPIGSKSLIVYGNLKSIKNNGIQIKDKSNLAFPQNYYLGSNFSSWKYGDYYYLYNKSSILQFSSKGMRGFEMPSHSTSGKYVGSRGEFWLGSFNGILKVNIQDLNKVECFLPNEAVSDIIQDLEGNYWASTLNNGVYYIKKTNIETLALGKVRFLKAKDDRVYFRKDFKLGMIDSKSPKSPSYIDLGYPISDIYLDNEMVYLVPSRKGENFKPLKNIAFIDLAGGKVVSKSKERFSVLNKRVLTDYYNGEKQESQVFKNVNGRNVFDIYYLNDSSFWFSNLEGSYEVTHNQNQSADVIKLTDNPLRKIEANDDFIFGALKGIGLIVYDKQWNVLDTVSQSKGLSSNFITDIISYKNSNVLFLATSEGVDIIKYFPNSNPEVFNRITTQKGLLSNDIRELCLTNENLLIATLPGLQQVNVSSFFTPSTEQLVLNILKVNDEYVVSKNRIELPSGIDRIRVEVAAISFNNLRTRTIEYRIKELNPKWTQTRSSFIDYANIGTGEYTFQIRIPNSERPEDIKSLGFVVSVPFYESTSFLIVLGNLILGLIFLGFYIKSRIMHQRLKTDVENARLRQVALTSRLSPHFLFNTLGGIQTLIFKKDNDKAIEFITKFSTLMRHMFKRSEEDNTSLIDEIAFINDFVEVENLKYSMKTSVSWNIEEPIDSYSYQIPSMFIQPLVENAIKHGFLYFKNDGIISIHLSIIMKGMMQITIEDNGKGRTLNENIEEERGHSSELLKNRIRLMQKVSSKGYSLEVEDKKSLDEKTTGTIIILKLPYVII